MPNNPRFTLGGLLVTFLLILAACNGGTTPGPVVDPTSQPVPAATLQATEGQTALTWQVTVIKAEVKESLHTEAGVTQYDGSVTTIPYDHQPSSGKVFLIIDLAVSKAKPGGQAFSWKNLVVKDTDGNPYHRMEDDNFLSSHTYNRMAGTDLRLGANRGVICFEIPQERAGEVFSLVYTSDEGETVIPLP